MKKIIHKKYPILEHDRMRTAVTEPARLIKPKDVPEHCVLCFFQEVIDRVVKERKARVIDRRRWETGVHMLYEIRHRKRRISFCHPGVGAPYAAGMLEELIALGCRKFMVCGGAGVLDREIAVGQIVVPRSAVRDEGTSYHYLFPARTVAMQGKALSVIKRILRKKNISHVIGKTWTTDAPYRETTAKVRARRDEGCLTVEMETAALFAVARFRKTVLGQILYGGDDVSGEDWDSRRWWDRKEMRARLFWLAADICLEL